jgi:hypothetical protein
MTGLVRKTTLLAVCSLLAAGAVWASVPDPANCECPSSCIRVVGHNGLVGDLAGEYCVTVRDFNNVPITHSLVVIDFSNCDLQLCPDQLDPGVTVDCVSETVRKLTDVNGRACFRVIGKSRPGLGCAGASTPCANVFADGVFLCNRSTPTFDLANDPGGAGVEGNDLAEWLSIFFRCSYRTRADYDCDNVVGANDLSVFLGVFFSGRSALGCPPAAKCP